MVSWWAVALGAAVGAPCRYLLDALVARRGPRLPWGTVAVNLLGSAAAGLLAGVAASRTVPEPVLALLATGFLGAFTTASTLAWQVVSLVADGARRDAALLVVVHVVPGVGLAGAGLALGLAL